MWKLEREEERGVKKESGLFGVFMENISFSWKTEEGETPVLKKCSLAVPRGEFWMLLGPNGCGKSTLLKILAGLMEPSGGRLRVMGPRSFVFQNPDHQVVMPTVCSDVAFGLGRLNLPEAEVERRVKAALAAVGMGDYLQRAVATLSGGQKQRVAIAGALAEGSRVLLLDELTTFLDQGDQVAVLEAIREVVGGEGGVTALWVTHRLEELSYADGAAYMEGGRVVVSGEVEEFRAEMSTKGGGWPAAWRTAKR